jgi:hypothetical protein
MARLNLTLDADTLSELDRHARRERRPLATLARELLREALSRRAAMERQRKLIVDYSEGAADAE